MTDAEKILELMHDGDSAEAIMRKILADRERLIEMLELIRDFECGDCNVAASKALTASAQTNDEILGERE